MKCAALVVLIGCASPSIDAREQRILSVLSDDNWLWAIRDPELVRLKLVKMQRGPYEWFRGTASLFWRDLMEPGADRPSTSFGDEASSHVLLVGDPHVENAGTFRAADGTMILDWNDFDATGYGPFTGDLRRLGASLAITAPPLADALVRRAVTSYVQTITRLANGEQVRAVMRGRVSLIDSELDIARTRGEALFAIDELAPATNGARALALGDLEPVADDGVIEDRVTTIPADHAEWIDRAIEQWNHPELGTIKLRARRIGPGVSSYAAFRWNVVLEGPTPSIDDDRVVEIKETREGIVIRGLARLPTAEWSSPAARSVDTQHRLQARNDADTILGSALVGGLSVKIRDREAFQRGINYDEVAALANGTTTEQAQALDLAAIYGEMLARSHGLALTEGGASGSGERGVDVIAPLLSTRDAQFVDELASLALADAAQITADHAFMRDRDLFAEVSP